MHVEAVRHHRERPSAVDHEPGDRQAALRAVLGVLGQGQRRVDEVAHLVVDEPGEHPQADPDLRRGQSGARRLQHRVGQVLDQPAELLVEVDHLGGAGAQHRVAEEPDGDDHSGPRSRRRGAKRGGHSETCELSGGSTWMRTGSSLRADRSRCSSPSASERAVPCARGTRTTARTWPGSSPLTGDRAEHLRALRPVEQGQHVVDRADVAGQRGEPGRRRQVRLTARLGLALGEAGVVPADQRLQGRVGGVADREGPAARPQQPDRVAPAAQRLLVGPQVVETEGEPGVQQDHRGVAAVGDRLGPRRRHDDGGGPVDLGEHPVARRHPDHGPGERPAELLGGAGLTDHRRPEPALAALRAGPGVGLGPAPAAAGRRRGRGDGQRPLARTRTGRACGT